MEPVLLAAVGAAAACRLLAGRDNRGLLATDLGLRGYCFGYFLAYCCCFVSGACLVLAAWRLSTLTPPVLEIAAAILLALAGYRIRERERGGWRLLVVVLNSCAAIALGYAIVVSSPAGAAAASALLALALASRQYARRRNGELARRTAVGEGLTPWRKRATSSLSATRTRD